jgi:HYR domain
VHQHGLASGCGRGQARDDGAAVAVKCRPRSGSFFRRGRTSVTCSATDANGNTATATFVVTVKPFVVTVKH